jgi:hypothetical protein
VEQTLQECGEQETENLATFDHIQIKYNKSYIAYSCLERIDWQFTARLAYFHVMQCTQGIKLHFSTDFQVLFLNFEKCLAQKILLYS